MGLAKPRACDFLVFECSSISERMPPQEKLPDTQPQDSNMEDSNTGFTNKAFVGETTDSNQNMVSTKITEKSQAITNETLEFDDLLPHIGEFGLYQKILFLLMIPFAFFVAWVYFTQIFITLAPEQHWCWVPELANLTQEQR